MVITSSDYYFSVAHNGGPIDHIEIDRLNTSRLGK